jgi:hypothetical protein
LVKIAVLGLQGSGKSYFTREYFLRSQPYHLVIDPMDEYDGFTRYVPHTKLMENYDSLNQEIALIHRKLVWPNILTLEKQAKGHNKPKRLRMLVYEEADMYMPSQRLLNASIRRTYIQCRHMQLDLIAVSRRPTDLNTYVMDVADYLIVFKISGANALKTLRNMNADCVDAVRRLSYDKHEFILFDRDRSFEQYTLDTIPDGIIKMEK